MEEKMRYNNKSAEFAINNEKKSEEEEEGISY